MITHIVLFKLADPSPSNIEKTKQVLEDMEGKIPQLRYIEVGIDVVRSQRSYDLALITRFDSLEDLRAYQVHPVHVKVLEHINSVRENVVAVDFQSE
ncbi:MAG: Dabb family protein [Bacillota bacterium]